MAEDGRGWSEMARDGWERTSYDLFPDGLYAKDLKRGALALRDFFLIHFQLITMTRDIPKSFFLSFLISISL